MELLGEDDPMAPQLNHGKITLKPHQLVMLHKCQDMENMPQSYKGDEFQTSIGIIGDKVGSGKSYVILALILNTINKPINCLGTIRVFGLDKIIFKVQRSMKHVDTNVIILPHNIIHQWRALINSFKGITTYFISQKSNMLKVDDLEQYNLVVVSSTFYKQFASKMESVQFKRVFFDEIDSVNIPNCLPIFSNFTWFITASYNNIVYPKGHSEWNNIVHKYVVHSIGLKNKGFVNNLFLDITSKAGTDFVKRLVIKNNDDFVDKSFMLPDIVSHRIVCKQSPLINILNGMVSSDVISCLNAEDVASAISIVNAWQKGTEENIINVILSKYHKLMKNIELSIEYTNKREFDNESNRDKELAQLTQQKTDMLDKVFNIRSRIKNTNTCNICFDDISNKTITKCCQNSFCFKCITRWIHIKDKCPCCNQSLPMEECFIVQDTQHVATLAKNVLSPLNNKTTNLSILLESLKHKKMLIFSAYNESFKTISQCLHTSNIKYDTIKGTSNHIKNVVENFKSGDVNALLVNAVNYGSGLNFENTTDIIIFHQFSDECTRQVIGRAQRMGRKEPLNVWYLLNDNEQVF